jgi:hypothetical protein
MISCTLHRFRAYAAGELRLAQKEAGITAGGSGQLVASIP